MIPLETILATYGYWAILIGTFAEGETILVLGGFAAHRGYLALPWVIAVAFIGSLCGDQLFFYLGRTQSQRFLTRNTLWKDCVLPHPYSKPMHISLLIYGFNICYWTNS